MLGFVSQLSVAIGVETVGIAEHSTVISCGTFAKIGEIASPTEICCVPEVELPQASVAVHVRVKLYDPIQFPGIEVSPNIIITFISQLSVAVTTPGAGGGITASQLLDTSAGRPARVGATATR